MRPLEQSPVPRWLAPGALGVIAGLTAMTTVYAIAVGPVAHWPSTSEYALYAVLVFIAVNSFISVRFRQVSLVLRRARHEFAAGNEAVAAKRLRGAALLPYAYSDASAVYGLVFSTLTGMLLLSLSFCVFAFVMFALLHPYASKAVAETRRDLVSRSGSMPG